MSVKISSFNIIIYFFALTGPLSTTPLDIYNLGITAFLFLILTIALIKNNGEIKINSISATFILSYFSFIILSIFSLCTSVTEITSTFYLTTFFSRLATASLCLVILIEISSWINTQHGDNISTYLKLCFFSTLVFLLFSLYQMIAFEYNLPFIETRSNVYGASYETKKELGFRLTSIAREPNFYAPLLIESILLSLALTRKKFLFLFIPVTLFLIHKTHSTGAYLHLFLILTAFILINRKSTITIPFLILISLVMVFLLSYDLNNSFFIEKLKDEISGNSSRSYIYLTILSEFFKSDTLHLLFGYGINTLQLFNELSQQKSHLDFSVSNNFYIDILWDSGIVGFILFVSYLIFIFIKLKKISKKNRHGLLAFLFFINIIITSLYRSEYTTTHFVWTSIIMLALYKLSLIHGDEK
ncbi:O-antigen ligase family protein [Providencia sp. PROV188]|uniref:O-antigen ligase family protein n=1 Tax=Providencia sp. PROV188 TaxID=2939731 RepID=UPI0022DD0267|nr:O-antigen ligase family protein [Providencia sp. PROV188]